MFLSSREFPEKIPFFSPRWKFETFLPFLMNEFIQEVLTTDVFLYMCIQPPKQMFVGVV